MSEDTPTFTIGYNTPGYSPEPDDVYVVEGEKEAREAMWHELDRHSDHIEDYDPEAKEPGSFDMLGQIDHAKAMLEIATLSHGWDATICNEDPSSHDLGTHYWITPGGVVEEDA